DKALGDGYVVLYARNTSGNVFSPLFTKTVQPNRPEVVQGPAFGNNGDVYQLGGVEAVRPIFAGGSSGFNDLLFEVDDALLGGTGSLEMELEDDVKTEIAKNEVNNYLYDSVAGHVSLVDVSPEGKVVSGATFGGPSLYNPKRNAPDFGGAISSDGKRVYWSSLEPDGKPIGVYLRKNPTESQSPIVNGQCAVSSDACTVLVSGGGEAQYWASAADGRYAFYIEAGRLYRFDAESAAGGGQVSREALTDQGSGVLGVLGVSESGGGGYFVATGGFAGADSEGETPLERETNLYLSRTGVPPIFIGTLSGQDGSEVPPFSEITGFTSTGEDYYGDWSPGLGQR